MSVKILIPSPLRPFFDNASALESSGSTVGQLLQELIAKSPRIESKFFRDGNVQLNKNLNIFINQEDIRFLQNLETTVADGDEVSIVTAVSGG